MKSYLVRLAALAAVFGSAVAGSAVMFNNYGFGTGNDADWLFFPTSNGVAADQSVDIFDMDAGGPLGTTFAWNARCGQQTFNEGVPEGIYVYQDLLLRPGCAYQVSFNWGVLNNSTAANFEGGMFSVIYGGSPFEAATDAAGFIDPLSYEFGKLTGVFKNPFGAGLVSVGAGIKRPYLPPNEMRQYVDNFEICPFLFDGNWNSAGLTNWAITPTANGQTVSTAVVPAGAMPNSPLGSGNALRLEVGQVVFTSGVQEGVIVHQPAHLNAFTKYRLGFRYGAARIAGSNNAQGGVFQVTVDGALTGTAVAAGSTGTTPVTGSHAAEFIAAAEGVYQLGVRVTRPFTVPAAPNNLYQFLDDITLTKANTTVAGRIRLENWDGANTYPPCFFQIARGGTIVEQHEINLDSDGFYAFQTALRGEFNIWVKSTHWLGQRRNAVAISDAGVSGLNFSLMNGDADPDNEVNLVDAARLSASFGLAEGDPGFDWWADLDGDGEVNLVDWGIFSANFGQIGDDIP